MPSPPPASGGGWKLVPYIEANGKSQVLDWIAEMRKKDFRDYVQLRESLWPEFESRGPFAVGGRYWAALGDALYEIRFANRRRIYCSIKNPRLVMMYMGVLKMWPKFRPKDR
jgi:hypothetical protein